MRRLLASLIAFATLTFGAHAAPFAFVYVSNSAALGPACSANLYVIDLATDTIVQTETGAFVPRGMAAQPGYPFVLQAASCISFTNQSAGAYDPTTNSNRASFFGARSITSAAIDPSGARFYIASAACITTWDASTFTRIAESSPGCTTNPFVGVDTYALATSPVGNRLYYIASTGSTGIVGVRDTASNTAVTSIPIPPPSPFGSPLSVWDAIAVNDTGSRVLVTNASTDSVLVIDSTTNTIITSVPVGSQPSGVIVAGTRAYISNFGDGTVSVLDLGSNTIVATIPVGANPANIDVNPARTRVYVPGGGKNGQLTVIDVATNAVVDNIVLPTTAQSIGIFGMHGRFIGGVSIAPAAVADARQVPTLSEWATIALAALLALSGALLVRRRLR
jgi:YVTN family beta-propeller protein